MNFPKLNTARILTEKEMLEFRGGLAEACGSGCKSGSMEIGNRTRCYYGWR